VTKLPYDRALYSITWCGTLKFAKGMCELVEAKHFGKERKLLVPNIDGAFVDFNDWVRRATRVLANKTCETSGCTVPVPAMCVDTKGRRCYQGSDFARARDEGTFPVSYFWDCKPETINGN
jgi:phage FluMu gp28-like protein